MVIQRIDNQNIRDSTSSPSIIHSQPSFLRYLICIIWLLQMIIMTWMIRNVCFSCFGLMLIPAHFYPLNACCVRQVWDILPQTCAVFIKQTAPNCRQSITNVTKYTVQSVRPLQSTGQQDGVLMWKCVYVIYVIIIAVILTVDSSGVFAAEPHGGLCVICISYYSPKMQILDKTFAKMIFLRNLHCYN